MPSGGITIRRVRFGRRISKYDLLIDQKFVVQRQVVAVGIERRLVERIDDDVMAHSLADFVAG